MFRYVNYYFDLVFKFELFEWCVVCVFELVVIEVMDLVCGDVFDFCVCVF